MYIAGFRSMCESAGDDVRSIHNEDASFGKATHDGIWRKGGGKAKMMLTSQVRQVYVVISKDHACIPGGLL